MWSQTGRLAWSQAGRLARSQAGWFVLVVLGWSAFLLTVPVDPDYTAGELLDHLLSWRETGALYPALGAEPALRVFNYPPLVMLAVRGLVELGVPGLMAGRLMNAAGLVALVSGVAWWVRARGTIVGTVGLLGASFPLLYAAGQFHIELWAAALTLWGFALLDRATRWPGIVTGALALTAACFAKQTQVVPALVALAWTWTHRRDVAVMASVTAVGAAAFGATALTLAWGVEPWRQMVTYTVGTYSIGNLGEQLRSHVAPWAILIGFAARVAWARDRGPDGRGAAHGAPHGAARGAQLVAARVSDPAVWYFVGSALWCLSAARVGSGYPYFLDLHLATVVLVGPRLFGVANDTAHGTAHGTAHDMANDTAHGTAHGTTIRAGRPAAAVRSRRWRWLLTAQIVGANVGVAVALSANASHLARDAKELPALCNVLRTEPRLLAEEAGIVRACGLRAQIHPFIMTSLAAQGHWDPALFEHAVQAGRYAVLLPFDPRQPANGAHAQRWTPGALAAFRSAPTVDTVPTGRWLLRWNRTPR